MKQIAELTAFAAAYIEAALWSSTDDKGNFLDSVDNELAEETRAEMLADCANGAEIRASRRIAAS